MRRSGWLGLSTCLIAIACSGPDHDRSDRDGENAGGKSSRATTRVDSEAIGGALASSSQSVLGGAGGAGGESSSPGGASSFGGTSQSSSGGSAFTSGVGGTTELGGSTGTGGTPSIGGQPSVPPDDETGLDAPFATAGFIELEPHSYVSRDYYPIGEYTASSAKLFYSFIPADKDAKKAPVFVIFNGGPGSATMGTLRVFGTGPFTLEEANLDAGPVQNPYSWSALGNLLYIDARQAGFSYSTLANPESETARADEANVRNYNLYADAADFVRVVLRFLKSQPALRNNPVVIVGESYGGMRASAMLQFLQHPSRLLAEKAWHYTDEPLAGELREHYKTAFPNDEHTEIEGALAARQFGHQVLIQPALAFNLQFDQTFDKCNPKWGLSARIQESDIASPTCPPENVNNYNWGKPEGWSKELDAHSRMALLNVDTFTKLIGVDPRDIFGLPANDRPQAYRSGNLSDPLRSPLDPDEFTAVLGVLPAWDRYFRSLADTNSLFQITGPHMGIVGAYFLENLIHTRTLITRARLDSAILSDGIAEMLSWYATVSPAPILSVQQDVEPRTGIERPGWITVTYSGNTFTDVSSGETRTIRFPTYHDAGHMVTISSPAEFYEDVRDFMRDSNPAP